MIIEQYLSAQEMERQNILSTIHAVILDTDKTVTAEIGKMMGKDMILYNAPGSFKYGLSSVKKHMSLHLLPIYCVPELHSKYEPLFPKASFQKGCINFANAEEIPLDVLKSLLAECAKIDLLKIRDEQLKSRKK